MDIITAKLSDKNTKEEIDRVFKLFDKDRNGTLEADDLSRVCKELGEDMTEEDIREVIMIRTPRKRLTESLSLSSRTRMVP